MSPTLSPTLRDAPPLPLFTSQPWGLLFLFVRLLTSHSNWILALPAENDFGPIVFYSLPSAADRGLDLWPCLSYFILVFWDGIYLGSQRLILCVNCYCPFSLASQCRTYLTCNLLVESPLSLASNYTPK